MVNEMKPMFTKVKATLEHADRLSQNLSIEDCNELVASGSLREDYELRDVRNLLRTCVQFGGDVYTILDQYQVPVMIGGVAEDMGYFGAGTVWMLTSKTASMRPAAQRAELLLMLSDHLNLCLQKYVKLHNVMWKKNTGHYRFLYNLGAKFREIPDKPDFLYFSFE